MTILRNLKELHEIIGDYKDSTSRKRYFDRLKKRTLESVGEIQAKRDHHPR